MLTPEVTNLSVVILHAHSRCNCRCRMCDIWKETGSRELSAAELSRYLDDFVRLGVTCLVFSGGEPLMHSDLRRLCCLVKARGIRTTILTTGLLLERNAAWIAGTVDDLIVSLDGPSAVHDRIRGVPGAFAQLSYGVRAVQQLNPQLPISARCTVQRLNHHLLGQTAREARQLGLNSVSFLAADLTSPAFGRPDGWNPERQSEVALDRDEIDRLAGEVDGLIQTWAGKGFVLESPAKLRRLVDHFRAHLGLCEPVAPSCIAPWISAVIETDGTVRPCFFHPPIGRIGGEGFLPVLNGPEAIRFRSQLDIPSNLTCQRCVCSLGHRPSP